MHDRISAMGDRSTATSHSARTVGLDFGLGLIDQFIISGSSFLLTLVLANALEPRAFGRFSIAWSLLILLEGVVFRGLFDDGLPAAAHRIPAVRWPQLRLGLYISSVLASGCVGVVLIVAGIGLTIGGSDNGLLAVATGVAVPASRLQSMFRRFCYLDGRLFRVVASSFIYLVFLVGSTGLMIATGSLSPAIAMSCVAISAFAAGSLSLLYARDLMRPRPRLLRWSVARLFKSGKWFVATSLTYWLGSIGLIPLCGMIVGVEASGSLRIILLIFAPLSQFCTALVSVRLPRIARALRTSGRGGIISASRLNALILGGLSAAYGLAITLFGEPMLGLLIGGRGYQVGRWSLVFMAIAMTLDGIWLGRALPLFAIGKPQVFLLSRIVGLVGLCCALPGAVYAWGVTGAVASMAISSVLSVVALILSDRQWIRPPLSSVQEPPAMWPR